MSSFAAKLTVLNYTQFELFLALPPSPHTCALRGLVCQCSKNKFRKDATHEIFLDSESNENDESSRAREGGRSPQQLPGGRRTESLGVLQGWLPQV